MHAAVLMTRILGRFLVSFAATAAARGRSSSNLVSGVISRWGHGRARRGVDDDDEEDNEEDDDDDENNENGDDARDPDHTRRGRAGGGAARAQIQPEFNSFLFGARWMLAMPTGIG